MIIVNLKGGLGNQMFQYAAGRRLAEACGTELKLDRTFLSKGQYKANVTLRNYELSIFNVEENFATHAEVRRFKNLKNVLMNKFFPGFIGNKYVKEKFFHFDPRIMSLGNNRYLDGHWMSEKYFADIQPVIKQDFSFRNKVINDAKNLHAKIVRTNSVCLQVRRGDYIKNPEIARVHLTTSLDYFSRAIATIKDQISSPVFFVFSDDIEWCYEHLNTLDNMHFVEKELRNKGTTNSDYLQLMIACKHFIISNSTFGWWGAWLSENKTKIVIAPKKWFNISSAVTTDIYPYSWFKI